MSRELLATTATEDASCSVAASTGDNPPVRADSIDPASHRNRHHIIPPDHRKGASAGADSLGDDYPIVEKGLT